MIPSGFEEKMRRLLGGEFDEFLASYDAPRNVGLRVNPKKPAELSRFGLSPVPWAEGGFYYYPQTRPGLSPYHEVGAYYLQEPSAMAPAGLLDVQPGMRVLDLCAAPGGKSTQLAASLGDTGVLIANEIHPQRAKILSRNLERMGAANAVVLNEPPEKLAARFPDAFDRILVDAPCSGEGMFRKEEAAAADWSAATVAMCAARQYEILCSAARMLRGGGRLVYSTCTFSPEENEVVIARFLRAHPDFYLPERLPLFEPGRPEWADDPLPELANTYRLWPHRLRGEGHFAAVLMRRGDADTPYDEQAPAPLPREIASFARDAGAAIPDGLPVPFGDTWYLAPHGTPALAGLKVLRAGLALGEVRKDRLEPAHAWALWLRSAAQTADFSEAEIAPFLRGQTLPGTQTGWTLVTVDGLSLSWAKGSDGVLKNHFPKGLRWR